MKKGFTLIELLAVILVLGIIALIAIPVVTNIIKDAKKKTLGVDCRTIYNAVDNYREIESLMGRLDSSKCTYFEFDSNRTNKEEISGNIYEPVDSLNLHNINYSSGYASLCGEAITVFVNNTSNTCLVTDNSSAILDGSVSDNDITSPVLNDIALTTKSNAIVVSVDATETDGIVEKYFYKIDGGSFVESNLPTHVFSGLQKESTHTITVYVENRSGLKSQELSKTDTTTLVSMPMSVVTQIPTDTEYATSKKAIVNFNTDLTHFIKSSVAGSVNASLEECGTGSNPGICTSVSITSLLPNTWYKVNNNSIEVTYVSDGTLTAKEYDGTNYSEEKEVVIDKIDTELPQVSVIVSGKVATIVASDNSGLVGYGVGITEIDEPIYDNVSGLILNRSYTATEANTYYVWIKDVAGNVSVKSFVIDITAFNYDPTLTTTTYNANKTCTSGRTYSNGHCTYYYSSNASKCGSSSYECNCRTETKWYCGNQGYDDYGSWICINDDWRSYEGESCSTCTAAKSCTLTEDQYLTYVCDDGDILNSTTCTKNVYSCPDGGTLNGTICER